MLTRNWIDERILGYVKARLMKHFFVT